MFEIGDLVGYKHSRHLIGVVTETFEQEGVFICWIPNDKELKYRTDMPSWEFNYDLDILVKAFK